MKKKIFLLALLFLPMLVNNISAATKPVYKNPNLKPEERAKDLLGRMTIDEKIAQLGCIWGDNKRVMFTNGRFDAKKAALYYKNGMGFVARPNEDLFPKVPSHHPALHPREAAELYNQIQRYFVEQTRLGIPVIAHDEGVHGQLSQDATVFPAPMALGSTWDEGLMARIGSITAREIRSKGGSQCLGPVLDIVRDPRWGRTDETMGEDPYLNGRMGVAEVKAMQGINTPWASIDQEHVGVTLKHFGVHGQSEGGHNTAPSYIDEHEARSSFFAPFRYAIKEASPMYMMITYNEIWGRPSHANRHLLQGILRGDFQYKGTIVSDYGGIAGLHNTDGMSPTLEDAAVQAFNAGLQVEFPNIEAFNYLKSALEKGLVKQEQIDAAVLQVLTDKFRLGLFEHPYVDVKKADGVNGCEAHRKVAYEAATKSMVLLKNDNNFLPLDKNQVKSIALIGPNADRCIRGGYSGYPRDTITPLRAIREKYGEQMKVLYAEGCRITDQNSPFPAVLKALTHEQNKEKIRQAVETARQADYVVLFVGGNESTSREAYGPEAPGDLSTLDLLAGQKELIREIVALGKPTCAFVNSGTTLNLQELESLVPAVMQCWYLGQEGGYAMIDALFGDINPSGKLTISFPRDAGHIPAFYYHKPLARRGYNLGLDASPLHPFGHGLSYTTYRYSNLRINKNAISLPLLSKDGQGLEVSVDIENTGKRDGDEIVQMYIRDDYATLTRPVKELRGFERIHLNVGEKKTVTFHIDHESLAFWNMDNQWVVEPGTFTVFVGPSSQMNDQLKFEVLQ